MNKRLSESIESLGRKIRAETGASAVGALKRLKLATTAAEALGRAVLQFGSGLGPWFCGASLLGFYFSVEAQLNHSIMHGAFAGLPGAGRYTPARYESLALPFQSRTWGDAHRIHHANPSLVELDPDTVHPLFRVHGATPWKPWHLLNTFLGALTTFEFWAFDYDRLLKKNGNRPADDLGEILKFSLYTGYHFLLFPALAGARWKVVLLANITAAVIRNLIFTGLQTASSVGEEVSTAWAERFGRKKTDEWYRFQVETSKNFGLTGFWRNLCGGLDRHIEHHLFPNIPPARLYEISARVRNLCRRHGVHYIEYPSFWRSLADSLTHLGRLSIPGSIL